MAATTLSVDEAAALLGVHPQSLRRELKSETCQIPHVRIGRSIRIPTAPLEHYLQTGRWPEVAA